MTDTQMLVPIEVLKATDVFVDGGVDKLIAKLDETVRKLNGFDTSTEEGRAGIRSLAYKIARTKTGIDDLGKEHVADLKRAAGEVDAYRRTWRDWCDGRRDEVRKPIDEWEAEDKRRVDSHVEALEELRSLGSIIEHLTVYQIEARLEEIEAYRQRDWQEFSERAQQLLEQTPSRLQARRAAAIKYEAEQRELAQLRQKAAVREAKEREEREARERQEYEERIAKQAAEAEQRRAQEAIDRAQREQAAAEARAKLAEQEAKRAAEQAAERAVQEERKRAAEAQAKAEQERLQEEAAALKRAADKEHQREVNRAAVEDLVSQCSAAGMTEPLARAVVMAIALGNVSGVTIKY